MPREKIEILKGDFPSELHCDQCVETYYKCDRKFPICSRCRQSNRNCTRNRVTRGRLLSSFENVFLETSICQRETRSTRSLKKKNVPSRNYSFTFNSKFNSATELNSKQSIISKKKNFCFDELKHFPGPVSCKFMASDWEAVLKKWSSDGSTRFDLMFFVNMSGVPLFHSTFNDRQFLSRFLLNKINFRPPSSQGNVLLSILFFNDTQQILKLAFQAYFHYANPFSGPFTKLSFLRKPRSWLLRLAVWRVGASFLNQTPLCKQLTHLMDKQLMMLTNLSRLPICLDSIQALLVLLQGVYRQPLFNRARTFIYLVDIMTGVLGVFRFSRSFLNFPDALEWQLAINMLTFTDHRQTYRSNDFQISCFHDGHANLQHNSKINFKHHFPTVSLLYHNYYEKFLYNTGLRGKKNLLSSHYFPTSSNSKDLAGDLTTIVISSHVAVSVNITKNLHKKYLETQNDQHSISCFEQSIRSSLDSLKKVFLSNFHHLHSLKAVCVSSIASTTSYCFVGKSSLKCLSAFSIYNCPKENIVLCQAQLYISLCYHYYNLHLISYSRYLPVSKIETKLKPKPKSRLSGFSTCGLISALQIIKLITFISYGPFNIQRIYLILNACRVIISHYPIYSNLKKEQLLNTPLAPFTHPTGLSDTLKNTLKVARDNLVSGRSNTPFKYFYTSNITMLDALLSRHNIQLSP